MAEVKTVLNVPDVSCEHCVHAVQGAIGDLPSVRDVQVNLDSKEVAFAYDPDQVQMTTIEEKLDEAGYTVAK